MQVRRGITSTATEATGKATHEKDAVGTPAATAMPAAQNRLAIFARLHRHAPADRAEPSAAGRPRTRLKVLERAGLGLATLSLTAVAGCSSGSSGLGTSSPEPTTAPPSTGQSIDPAPTDSSAPSTSATDPSTSAASPTSVPSLPVQPDANVLAAKTTLDQACQKEAYMIVSSGRPASDQLGQAFDGVQSALYNDAVPGSDLQPALDGYLLAEENIRDSSGASLPEPVWVHEARQARLEAYVQYTLAEFKQTPTDANRAEWQSAMDTRDKAARLPVEAQSNATLPDWLSPG